MAEEVCEACGERNRSDAEFCVFCGSYLGWQDRQEDPEDPPTDPVSAPPTDTSVPTATLPAHGDDGLRTAQSQTPGSPVGETQHSPPIPDAPAGVTCPKCSTVNEPGLRFCRKCGQSLISATPAAVPQPLARQGWWSRPWGSRGSNRAARAAYRHSLPMRYRLGRVVALLTVVGLVGVLLSIAGRNPIGWARGVWYNVTGAVEVVQDVQASALPEGSALRGTSAPNAVDGKGSTAWATRWRGVKPKSETCEEMTRTGGLVLTLNSRVRLRGMNIAAGLASGNSRRPLEWRPHVLDVYFDGGCKTITLVDQAGLTKVEFDTGAPVDQIRVTVAEAFPARKDGEELRVTIREIQLLTRPN